jgi:hypothetical protein
MDRARRVWSGLGARHAAHNTPTPIACWKNATPTAATRARRIGGDGHSNGLHDDWFSSTNDARMSAIICNAQRHGRVRMWPTYLCTRPSILAGEGSLCRSLHTSCTAAVFPSVIFISTALAWPACASR